MEFSYFLIFLSAAVPTVMSPGPGVLMSVSNCLRYGLRGAQPGVIGVAFGTFVVAALSATGLGVLLATNATAYLVVKLLGVAFLVYLGWMRLKAPAYDLGKVVEVIGKRGQGRRRLFIDGVLLQLSNPALIVFYVSLFPQCISPNRPYFQQFVILSLLYMVLVYVIHMVYGYFATSAQNRFLGKEGSLLLNRICAISFFLIAIAVLVLMALE